MFAFLMHQHNAYKQIACHCLRKKKTSESIEIITKIMKFDLS